MTEGLGGRHCSPSFSFSLEYKTLNWPDRIRWPTRHKRRGPIPDLGDRAVFIIGFARSGTTILQNALNASPDFFLFGEPDFHRDPGTPDFAARYNAMHRAWRNQPTKSTFCPPVLDEDAPWWAHLTRLSALYRFVGSKIVVNPSDGQRGINALYAFQCRHFYRARTIFAFRAPHKALSSIQELANFRARDAVPADLILGSYVRVIGLYIDMLRNQPHVCAVFYEDGPAAILGRVAKFTGGNIEKASAYYDTNRVRQYSGAPLSPMLQRRLDLVEELYGELREAVAEGPALIQLEQNAANLNPTHWTKLGRLAARVDMIAAAFDAPPPDWPHRL